uniref:Neural proliferation, differentiation and control, 1b n=1 Tax=Cynoglossus semilaevis TaxID=244447 RepID=A0A3P8VIN4_CYNSE
MTVLLCFSRVFIVFCLFYSVQQSQTNPLIHDFLDCAQAGRHFCQPGRSHCGPCLHHLVENSNGQCVVKRRHVTSTHPELDEEIDFLSAIISQQRTLSRLPGMLFSPYLPLLPPITAKNLQFSSTSQLRPHGSVQRHHNEDVCSADTCSLLLSWFTLLQPGDKKLAHSAQMYHYQHQKQQMLSLEKPREMPKVPDSGASTDEENEDGDFTVYECPGLAPTGEMEVKNPLFDDTPLYLHKFR